ncbi:MAG: hypothetical protein ACOCUW_01105 [Gemmatimonadota bacterium]
MIGVERAVAAAADWLIRQDEAEAAIASHEIGRAKSDEAARRWVRRVLSAERDGTWGDELPATLRALLTIHELRQAAGLREQDPAIGRALARVRRRTRVPGAWTGGCSPARHRLSFCHHFAGGFFSPGPPDVELSDVTLPTGVRVDCDAEARFALSCAALRSVLLWRGAGTDARLHLHVLGRLVDRWEALEPELDGLTTTALLAGLHALILSDRPADRDVAARGLERAAGRQRGDGSWADADPFHALAVYGDAADRGIGSARVGATLEHGTRLLVATQREDGSWGTDNGARRALIGLRALLRVTTTAPSDGPGGPGAG